MATGGGLADAGAVLVLLHGRGHDPSSMRELAARLDLPDVVSTAPGAPGGSWYPLRFIEPRAANEPALSEAIAAVERTLADVVSAGAALERVVLGGFSQGACLACDVLARNPRPLGGLAVLCGGLIGAGEDELAAPGAGTLDGLPVLITGTEQDAWVPVERVRRSAELLAAAGADVDLRVHAPAEHRVHDDEVGALRALVRRVAGG